MENGTIQYAIICMNRKFYFMTIPYGGNKECGTDPSLPNMAT
jgi:hypothetical protein